LDFNFSLIIVCFGIPNSGVNLKIKFDERHGVHRINFKTIRINIWKFILKIIVYANFIIFKYWVKLTKPFISHLGIFRPLAINIFGSPTPYPP
jgi:hypothetical protein